MALWVVQIDFWHFHLDIFINTFISEYHEYFSLLFKLINNIPIDIRNENVLLSISETKVNKYFLEHIKLLKHVFWKSILFCIIQSLYFFLSCFLQVLSFHTLISCLVSGMRRVKLIKPTLWNHLSEDQKLNVLINLESVSKSFDQRWASHTFNLIFYIFVFNLG